MANLTTDKMDKSTGSSAYSKVFHDGSDLEKMSQQAGEKIGTMASTVADSASGYLKQASQYMDNGRQYVRQNPARSLAIAVTAGVVAGGIASMILRRKQ
jgi:ElaB/YqjD/DUF883 family membrane-anchored ribosome-binding protein